MIVDKINAYLSEQGQTIDEALLEEVGKTARWSFEKQFGAREEKMTVAPYFSSIGKCLRQQSYKLLGFEEMGKEIDARAKMVFFQGDMTELAVIFLARQAGCNITDCGMKQKSIQYKTMRGRPDGILDGDTLVEVKSMASYSFERLENGFMDESYQYQCQSGMAAKGFKKCCFVALNKDAGVLHEMLINFSPDILKDIDSRLEVLGSATANDLPERPYAPDSKGLLPWQCLYCGFWGHCWPAAEKVLVRNSYKLKIKEPVQ